jgi:hypothetical protein
MSDVEKERDHLRALLKSEREQWEQERQQYQTRITELLVRMGAPVEVSSERLRLVRERVAELREDLRRPLPAAERNALAMELARLEPQLG